MYYLAPTSIHPLAPIQPSSAILTRITTARDPRKEDRKKYGAEYRSLAERLRPDTGPSVIRHERQVEKATIDMTNRHPVPGKKETAGAVDEDARRAADVAAIERGEPLQEMPDIKTQMAHVARKAAATEEIIEKLDEEFRAEFTKLSAAYCAKIRPDHDSKMKSFFKAFGEAFSIFADLQKTKRELVDSQMSFGGLFNVDLDFIKSDEVASMFNAAKAAGYISSAPKEFNL